MTRTLLAAALVAGVLVARVPTPASAAPTYFLLAAAVGAPGEDVGDVRDAGVVHLLQMSDISGAGLDTEHPVTITRATLGGTPHAGDRFGAAIELADVDDDNKLDLIIGAPGADQEAGRVYVVRFLTMEGRFDVQHPIVLQQGRAGLPGPNEPGDRFGSSLDYITPDFHGPWLAIGAPGEDVGSTVDAGAVTVIHAGTDTTRSGVYYQGSGVPGTAERGDQFGFSLARFGQGFAAGAPGEDVGPIVDAGNITGFDPEVLGSGLELHQGSTGVPGPSEAGDRFGAALTNRTANTVSIGVPGEDVGDVRDAGAVVDLAVPGRCCSETTLWYQGYNDLMGKAEAGDRFGAALAPGDAGDLLVGAPGENVGDDVDAGIVQIVPRSEAGEQLASYGNCQYHQDSPDVPGTGESGDQMGASLGWRGLVGMPGEDVHGSADAGAFLLLGIDSNRAVDPGASQQVTQDDLTGSSAERGDRFGSVLP
jgi:hypothetical protein